MEDNKIDHYIVRPRKVTHDDDAAASVAADNETKRTVPAAPLKPWELEVGFNRLCKTCCCAAHA